MPNNLKLSALDAIEAAERAATPGPWEWDGLRVDDDGFVFVPQGSYLRDTLITLDDTYEGSGEDCRLIALARNNTPALVAALRGALRVVESLNRHSYPLRGSVTYNDLIAELDDFRRDNPGLLPK